MANQNDERSYRKAEYIYSKQKARQKVQDNLMTAKNALIDAISSMEVYGIKRFSKLNTISKLESLQNDID